MVTTELLEIDASSVCSISHLSKLSPIQVMPSIEFKDEHVIDFSLGPNPAINHEEHHQNEHEEIAGIDL